MGIWMGVAPGSEWTRVLVQDGVAKTLLKARLPPEPQSPRALQVLAEGLALWCGEPVRAAVSVDGLASLSGTTPWLDTIEAAVRSPLYEIALVDGSLRRLYRRRDHLGGLGDFRDLRQMVLFEVAK